MSEEKPKTITIFDVRSVTEQPSADASEQVRVFRGGARDRVIELVETSVDEMSKKMEKFIESVSEILSSGAKYSGNFEIDSVEVECLISGSGQIGLAGTGLGVQGGSSLKIVFTRRKEKKDD